MTQDKDATPVVEAAGTLVPLIIYVLLLVGVAGGITALIAVILAYALQGRAPEWQRGHYRFLIRTFWIGLLYAFIASLGLWAAGLGAILAAATAIWLIVRCVKGIVWLQKGQEVPDPASWLLGERRA